MVHSMKQYIAYELKHAKLAPFTWTPCSKFGFDVPLTQKNLYPLLSL